MSPTREAAAGRAPGEFPAVQILDFQPPVGVLKRPGAFVLTRELHDAGPDTIGACAEGARECDIGGIFDLGLMISSPPPRNPTVFLQGGR